jgi:hypothetical protein
MLDERRRQALKYLGLFGSGVLVGGGVTGYSALQYLSETNAPEESFGRAPPDLAHQVRGSAGPLVVVYRRNRTSASGLDPEGEVRKLYEPFVGSTEYSCDVD